MHDEEDRIESFAARILRAIGQLLKEAASVERWVGSEGRGGEGWGGAVEGKRGKDKERIKNSWLERRFLCK